MSKKSNSTHKTESNAFDVLIVPQDQTKRPRKFGLTPRSFGLLIFLFIGLIFGITAGLIGFTPVGKILFPSTFATELEFREKYSLLSNRVEGILDEAASLREYNRRLRSAIGIDPDQRTSNAIVPPLTSSELQGENIVGSQTKSDPSPSGLNSMDLMSYGSEIYRTTSFSSVSFPAILPMEGYLSRGFDASIRHYGIDLAGKVGTPIVAAADGNIVFAGFTLDDGYMIIISHEGGFITIYKHCEALLADANVFVRRGEPIAKMGSTGRTSYGPHLHFEIWKDGIPVDPTEYFLNLNT